MEIKIGNENQNRYSVKSRMLLGIKEGEILTIEASGDTILLKPKGVTVKETYGLIKVGKVEINEIDKAAGKKGIIRFIASSNMFVYYLAADPIIG